MAGTPLARRRSASSSASVMRLASGIRRATGGAASRGVLGSGEPGGGPFGDTDQFGESGQIPASDVHPSPVQRQPVGGVFRDGLKIADGGVGARHIQCGVREASQAAVPAFGGAVRWSVE